MEADALFLPAVLTLGVVSTLQDFRVRRISNWWIIISLVYALAAHIILLVSGNLQEIRWSSHLLVNVLASAIVAVYFWRQNWWGGGDAKLFVSYAAMIPLSHYPIGYFSYYFASFLLLIITFAPAAIWTFLHAQFNLIESGRGVYYDFRPSKIRLWEFFQLSAGFTAIFFLSNLLILILNHSYYWIKDFPIVIWLVSLGFYKTIFRLFRKRLWLVIGSWGLGIGVIVLVPFFSQINVWRILMHSFVGWVLVFVLRIHIFRTIEKYVEWTKNNNMAFAGWMFLGAMMVWFSQEVIKLL